MNVSLNTSRDKGTGRDTVVTRTRVRSSRRTCLGDWVIEDGRADRLYTSAGYCDAAGDSVSFHYWVKDYLGSVRAICDSRGCLEQATDYLACGVPVDYGLPPSISTASASEAAGGRRAPAMAGAGDGTAAVQPELLTVDVDPHKHCGKELELFSGLGWYYNQARLYDPVVMRFTTLDPLAEKYYPTSPYAYCQNDPLAKVDLDGEKIEMATNSSVRFKEDYRIAYNYLKENQASFVLDKLEEIQHTYYIKEYSGDSYFDHKTNTIYWNPRKAIMTNTCYTLTAAEILSHEADHAVEYDTDPEGALKRAQTPDEDYVTKEEKRVIEGSEQQVALKLKRVQEFGKTRTNHFGNGFEVDSPIKEEVEGAVVVYNPNEPKSE